MQLSWFLPGKVMTSDLHDVCIPAPVRHPAALGQRALTYKWPGSFFSSVDDHLKSCKANQPLKEHTSREGC